MRFLRALVDNNNNNNNDDGDGDDDDSSHLLHRHNYTDLSYYYPREGNSSITTSLTIHVTPEHYHLVSWCCLWTGFVLAIAYASYQVWLEQKYFASRAAGGESSSSSLPNNNNNTNSGVGVVDEREQATFSTSDITRSRFRRLLLLAMSTRTVMIPVQMWSNPLWIQFVADTLPEMVFASAWTLLVSFFVQLVGIASGTGNMMMMNNYSSSTTAATATSVTGSATSASSSATSSAASSLANLFSGAGGGIMVIQLTAYVVYTLLIATYFWNPLTSVLLYALLCCIYAALLGTTLFFCPRLLSLLQPNLQRYSGLNIRLFSCTAICVLVFGGRTIGFARKVVAPPRQVSWWWQYGILELIPSVLFLVMMHRSNSGNNNNNNNNNNNDGGRGMGSANSSGTNTPNGSTSGGGLGGMGMGGGTNTPPNNGRGEHRRQGSHGSGKHNSRTGESAPLIKPHVSAYGGMSSSTTTSRE